MESFGNGLQKLPVDGAFILWTALWVVISNALRVILRRSARGRFLHHLWHIAEGGLLALLLLAMILFSSYQIFLRNLTDGGLIWIDPFLRHLVLWIGFLGALLATREGRHINIDALSRFLPPKATQVSIVTTNLFATVVCLLLANSCVKMVIDEASFGGTSFLGLPTWTLQSVMPLALLGMASRFLGHALRRSEPRSVHEAWSEANS